LNRASQSEGESREVFLIVWRMAFVEGSMRQEEGTGYKLRPWEERGGITSSNYEKIESPVFGP